LYRCIKIVIDAPKAFGAFLAAGLGVSLVLQAMINMSVAVGLFPVTGVTLPLVSMGGSSVVFTSIAFGIILSVSRDNQLNSEQENLAVA
jgi:cell division protein FtsW